MDDFKKLVIPFLEQEYDLSKFGGECVLEINGDTSGVAEIYLKK